MVVCGSFIISGWNEPESRDKTAMKKRHLPETPIQKILSPIPNPNPEPQTQKSVAFHTYRFVRRIITGYHIVLIRLLSIVCFMVTM